MFDKLRFKKGSVTVILNGVETAYRYRYDAINEVSNMWRTATDELREKLGNILNHLWMQEKVCTDAPCEKLLPLQNISTNDYYPAG